MKNAIRRWILKGLSCRIAGRAMRRLLPHGVFCVMLHRLGLKDPARLPSNEAMKVSPASLERFIVDARSKGFSFLSMSQLHSALSQDVAWPSRAIVITLDDGYRDNLLKGLPIFERHGVPFVIYLSTGFIGGLSLPWWYVLEELLSSRSALLWEGKAWNMKDIAEKDEIFMRVRERALRSEQGGEAYVSNLCRANGYDRADAEGLFLTWNDVRALQAHPLAEIGNHGHRHLNLQRVSREAAFEEFVLAKEAILHHTGETPMHYAYAYGLFDDAADSVIRRIGAATCVTTSPGWIFRNDRKKLLTLPRFMLYEGMSIDELVAQSAYVSLRKCLKR